MNIETLINLPIFTSGRRISIYNQMRLIGMRRNLTVLVAHIDRGLEHDRQTRELDNRWAKKVRGRRYVREVQELDHVLDPVLASVRDISLGHIRGLPEGDRIVLEVDAMLTDIFPAGVSAITSLPYIEQAAATETVVGKLQTEHALLVDELGLRARVDFLARLTLDYRTAIDHSRNLTFARVSEYRRRGQQLLAEVMALMLGMFHDSTDPQHVDARTELLEPVLEQIADLRATRRRRNNESDDDVNDGGVDQDGPDGEGPVEGGEGPVEGGEGPVEGGEGPVEGGEGLVEGGEGLVEGDDPSVQVQDMSTDTTVISSPDGALPEGASSDHRTEHSHGAGDIDTLHVEIS